MNFREGVQTDFGDAGRIAKSSKGINPWPWVATGAGIGNLILLGVG